MYYFACSRALLTASIIPLLVNVAPETMSTSVELFSTIAAGICSSAGSATYKYSMIMSY